ncbi:precorrin-6y C5,15-methyltransferase (decarboxylating) subunit CbiE [Vibrio sp. JC009]|uniref:precorrin-6y C5,15-methyltransferase (decarboxylating) subunit CbiE n=1 Tax=Vibrio sp. JC009 TaxID=2912314 RepID=UPI0023B1F1CA|nr:precorrin-6y C5,15-methyltransferase (decarboxylating) subunit CbiE [Vibrio sp. JC009]WED24652.1 precorrin-6y C5,15-methyltransferase (decarboxylating) subunit CbiE [Vibrio sp. JC009]
MTSITVVGVPEDGCVSLTSKAVNAVAAARVVAGHPRHLEWFPQFEGLFLDMSQGFSDWLSEVIDESEEGGVVVLASGDPLFFGIGSTLLKKMPVDELSFIPTHSSAQLAFSRLGIPWSESRFISCHGRKLAGLVAKMQQGNLFAILTDSKNTPQIVAAHMKQFSETGWKLSVCEQLGGTEETIRTFSVEELAESDTGFDPLNILVAQRENQALWGGHGQFSSDQSYLKRMPKNGLITKQSIRHLALTSMRIQSDDTVWDIGTGSGSVAIESAKFANNGQVYAVECNEECFESIQANIFAHGTDNVELIKGKAPEALSELEKPDAIFVGGSRGAMESILSYCLDSLKSGGRLVVSAVTMDTVAEVYQWAKQNDVSFDAQMVNVSSTQPLAHYLRYQAENPIHLFTITKTV